MADRDHVGEQLDARADSFWFVIQMVQFTQKVFFQATDIAIQDRLNVVWSQITTRN